MDWNGNGLKSLSWLNSGNILITWQWPSDYNCTEDWLLFGSHLDTQSHIANSLWSEDSLRHVVQTFVLPWPELFGSSLLLSYRKPCFFFWPMKRTVGRLSDLMWHCAHLSLLWSGWVTSPGEFQVLAWCPAASVGMATGRTSKKRLSVDRKGMSYIPTRIVISFVILGPSYFLYMICPIACTYLWSRLSLLAQMSAAELLLT